MTTGDTRDIDTLLNARFGDAAQTEPYDGTVPDVWTTLAGRGSVRAFSDKPVGVALVGRLAALALCAPSKSDLQQRDIIHVRDPASRARIAALLDDQPWTRDIPELLVFCGNNHRQRRLHAMRGHPFVNDHLDAFFNAAVDAGIALSAFVIAAEAAGLGCCPISAVRNHPEALSEILELPQHVFPVAGLAVGWPAAPASISPRLSRNATFHCDTMMSEDADDAIRAYDARRYAAKPYTAQRDADRHDDVADYSWSEDKARQYSVPERTGFGAYIRKQGFNLD